MGRSRSASRLADDDPNQRSRRKRAAFSAENLETLRTGHGINEGKVSLYHCNYCNKDISLKIRIKCVVCQDFDLCIECFSVGAEVMPHKSNHPYRVMDNLSFPLLCPDWNADEEMLLLEGIEMYGFGNWTEVAEYVGTKSKHQCIDHYNAFYMNSPCFPLPDLSHVMGKSREELLDMAEAHEVKKDTSILPLQSVMPLKVFRHCVLTSTPADPVDVQMIHHQIQLQNLLRCCLHMMVFLLPLENRPHRKLYLTLNGNKQWLMKWQHYSLVALGN